MKIIDLRSDTVTKPTPQMRAVMAEAEVGDDVFGEDPTVNELESLSAELLGKEAAIFVSSGTQGNLLALLSHCERGDEYIVGQQAHTYRWEGGGAAILGSIQPQPLEFESDGSLNLQRVAAAIKPDDFHFARTRLLCLENTQAGKVLSLEYLKMAEQFAKAHGLSLHLDGARVFNAAVALQTPVRSIADHFDSVSFCLSKGLGAPAGSVLCGSADLIRKARRWRKVLGGGMRQVGILAAAGNFALANHVERLVEDHQNADRLAEGLGAIEGIGIDAAVVQTNMVRVSVKTRLDELQQCLKDAGILIIAGNPIRLVTHLDISRQDVDKVVDAVKHFYSSHYQ